MRFGGSTIMMAFLLGAVPALGQESPGILPAPVKQVETSKPAPPVHKKVMAKVVAAKAAAPNISAPQTVPAKSANIEAQPAKTETATEPADIELSVSDRQRIQSALLWAGDYTGSLGGDDQFQSAIRNYQKRAKAKITGVLAPAERASLLASAKLHEDEYGWTVVVDPATGARIGLPSKLVPQVRDTANG